MSGSVQRVAILTYHSISNEPGPTSIAPEIFEAQMAALRSSDVDVVDLASVLRWRKGECDFTRRTVAITFDDAFRDFSKAAFPILDRFAFPSTVFAPTSVIGGAENWRGANAPARPLMDWNEITALAGRGVNFGSHSQSHADLATLPDDALETELSESRKTLESRLERPAPHFAPPYGSSDDRVRSAIARHYELSVGVTLAEADRSSQVFDLPRIEMFYYCSPARWREFLDGKGEVYLGARKVARAARRALYAFRPSPNH